MERVSETKSPLFEIKDKVDSLSRQPPMLALVAKSKDSRRNERQVTEPDQVSRLPMHSPEINVRAETRSQQQAINTISSPSSNLERLQQQIMSVRNQVTSDCMTLQLQQRITSNNKLLDVVRSGSRSRSFSPTYKEFNEQIVS